MKTPIRDDPSLDVCSNQASQAIYRAFLSTGLQKLPEDVRLVLTCSMLPMGPQSRCTDMPTQPHFPMSHWPLGFTSGLRVLPFLLCNLHALATGLFRFTHHFHFGHPIEWRQMFLLSYPGYPFVVAFVVDHCLQVSLMPLSPSTPLSNHEQITSTQSSSTMLSGICSGRGGLRNPHLSHRGA